MDGARTRWRIGTHALPPQLAKFLRYSAVALVFVPIGQILLNLFVHLGGWNPVSANLAVATICTPPNYLANRTWVWAYEGRDRQARDAGIFWICAVLGVLFSSLVLWGADQVVDAHDRPVLGAVVFFASAVIGYGFVWLGRFFIIDRYIFVVHETADPAA